MARRMGRSNRLGAVEVLRPNVHRTWWAQAILVIWRWSFELAIAVGLWWSFVQLNQQMPWWAAVAVMIAPVAVGLQVPLLRRQILGWTCVLFVRHRLRSALVELGARNRSWKLPWLIWWHPTPVGERVWLLMTAGLSVNDLTERSEELAAACMAREARVQRARRMAAFVRVDIVRKDPLEAKQPIASRLLASIKAKRGDAPDPLTGRPDVVDAEVRQITAAPSKRTGGPASGEAHWMARPLPTPSQPTEAGEGPKARTTTRTARKSTQERQAADPAPVVVNGEDLSDYV